MKEVFFSKRSATKLQNLLDFLEEEWSEKVKQNFIKKLDNALEKIKNFPESCEESDIKKGLFKCIITKQTTLYYRYNSKQITVVTLFDNRMNPKKLKKEI